jgi:putative flavoprotein involved in K+ transport
MKHIVESDTEARATAARVSGLIEEGEAFRTLTAGAQRKRFDVIVIGGGQAGLAVGYHLKKRGINFVILDASARVGDAWRTRWDTLRLFSPARYDGLDGMRFPGSPDAFPTKDEMADYLEAYAAHFQLPVMNGVRVDRLSRDGMHYLVDAGTLHLEAEHVVVAMASYQGRKIPAFAKDLSPEIVQLHGSDYKRLSQLKPGAVLVVGTGNSGAEIAAETVGVHRTWMSGRDVGEFPFQIANRWVQRFVVRFLFRFLFHRVFTVNTPIGRKVRAKVIGAGTLRIRQKRIDLVRAGVEWVDRTAGVKDGLPMLADGRTLDVRNVIWCTGYGLGLSWIDLPIFDGSGEPRHRSGLVESEPGLYFVGQHFQHSMSSTMIHGVSRDAARMAGAIQDRRAERSVGSARDAGPKDVRASMSTAVR